MKTIYLCGFMGCGKTTVGRNIAKKLGCEFYDLDHYIEEKEGMSIPEIFSKHGEGYFRDAESKAIEEFRDKKGVVATGGGALLSEKNAEIANDCGITVFIDTDFEICYSRIKGDKNRPIAFNSTKEQLVERFESRYPLYKAHSRICCKGDKTPGGIAQDIIESCKLFSGGKD